MCGIVAIALRTEQAAPVLVDCLTTLQHRGQDAAGIAVSEGYHINLHKSNGQVSELVEQKAQMNLLKGRFGIGHVRYPTAGSSSESEAQPFYTSCPFGVALAHNGNLTNTAELQRYCRLAIRRQLNTGSDSEACLAIFADELFKALKRKRHVSKSALSANSDDDDEIDEAGMESLDEGQDVPHPAIDSVFEAVTKCMKRFEGAYAIVVLINGLGVVGFRDPHGIRPLAYGTRQGSHGMDSMLASESVAVEIPGFDFERDVAPGEAVLIDRRGNVHTKQCVPIMALSPCIFEYVYFARQDSVIDGVSVYQARRKMGEYLAHQIRKKYPNEQIDVVVPVPATSRISAIQCAITLGVPYEEGLVRNRYSQRTFIMPGQAKRIKSVRLKLNPISKVMKGRAVLLVDDSIVRGTTSRHIVEMVRNAGASKVFFASAAPAIRYPNVYGIDMPTKEELIATGRTDEEIAAHIKSDWVMYQTLEDLRKSCHSDEAKMTDFDTSCFDGRYVAGHLDDAYFARLHAARNDEAQGKTNSDGVVPPRVMRTGSFVVDEATESAISAEQLGNVLPLDVDAKSTGAGISKLQLSPKKGGRKSFLNAQQNGDKEKLEGFKRERNMTPSSSSIADW